MKLVIGVVSVICAVFGIVSVIRAQGTDASWPAYTINGVEVIPNGPAPLQRKFIEAQRSDGSRVRANGSIVTAESAGEPWHYVTRTISFNRSERESIFADDTRRTITTHYVFSPARKPGSVDSTCGVARISSSFNPEVLGRLTILGFDTVAIQVDEGVAVRTDWKAPALGCATLKIHERRKDPATGQLMGQPFEMHAVSVSLNEPDDALFAIPAEYAEISPLSRREARARESGRELPPELLRMYEVEERKYRENHEKALKK